MSNTEDQNMKLISPLEKIVKSSIQIYVADPENMIPQGFGSGFILKYKGDFYLVSVSHVTDYNLTTFLETNLLDEEHRPLLKPIGGLMYFNLLKGWDGMSSGELENLLKTNGERMDITFARIQPPMEFKQTEIDFGPIKIDEGNKLYVDESEIALPDKDNLYGFFGKVEPEFRDMQIASKPTLKNDLKFHRTAGVFHMFLTPKLIVDSKKYQGCSGAPILDYQGKIVAVACSVCPNTKIIYGFSIQECIRLLQLAIDTKQI